MYYKPNGNAELSKAEMERVRKGFSGLLAKLRYHPSFIANNLDELLSIAHAEYVRYVEKGVEIEDPVAWTMNCAWRRTQNFLRTTKRRPQEVSSEKLAELVDETTPTPAQIAEDTDRARKVRGAVGRLDKEQRQLVALMYFEDMALADAARHLGWHESKARRCHEAARKRLFKFLAVKSSDELAVEVGFFAWLSFVGHGSLHLPGGFEAVLDKAGHEASGLWARAHELARRFSGSGGSDTASAVATSGAGRTAGVCATVAVACVAGASGVVGPGVGGGIGLLGKHDASHQAKPAAKARPARSSFTATATEPVTVGPSPTPTERPGQTEGASSSNEAAGGTRKATRQSERNQVKEQTDGFARASSESGTTNSPTNSSASSSSATGSTEATSTPASGSTSSTGSATESAQANRQFGAFR